MLKDRELINKEALPLEQIETPIIDALEAFSNNPCVALHIPGHGKNGGVLPKFENILGKNIIALDTTDEFDNLGTLHPETGPVKRAQELAAKAFNSEKSFFLVNGSTIGNLAIALTVTNENRKVIVSRNCHRSVISGLTMTGAIPIWAVPEPIDDWGLWGEIKPETIEKLITENPEVDVVWVTSPTYEGICSDIKRISEICRAHDVLLIVDEAHGSLWHFNEELPVSAIECGADAVVHSMHKTGGSFSQSSMLHLGQNSRINKHQLEANLKMLHTTSPSYFLLASLDAARAFLESKEGREKINETIQNAKIIRNELADIKNVECLSLDNIDLTKIYLRINGMNGKQLEALLKDKYHIEVEAALDTGILILSNIGNSIKELKYFVESIKKIADSSSIDLLNIDEAKHMPFYIPEMFCTPRLAFISSKEKISPNESIGKVAAEVIAVCPPGIPVLVPGERINKEHLSFLTSFDKIWVTKDI